MKVTKISKSLGHTLNLGNYQNLRFEASMEVELEPHEDVDVVASQLDFLVRNDLYASMSPTLSTMGEWTRKNVEQQLGLDVSMPETEADGGDDGLADAPF